MTEETARQLLYLLGRLNRRINALEMDSEGRGDDDCSSEIDDFRELLSISSNAKPTLAEPNAGGKKE